MTSVQPEQSERLHIAEIFRSHWLLFVLVGGLLVLAGGTAMIVPALSTVEPNEALGLVLMFVGIVQIAQSGKMQGATVSTWNLMLGMSAAIGGVFVYLDPFRGIVTITILMAAVFAIHGVMQIVFGTLVRQLTGWHWFLISGCIALLVAGLLMMKLPYGHSFTPATIGGISLIFAGWAYVAVALASRGFPKSATRRQQA